MSVAVLGEALVDLIADDDGHYRAHLGGSPFSVAIGLARQGVEVSYVSPLSDDVFGDQLATALAREGVRLSPARRSARPTSLALVTVGDDGQPDYQLYRQGVADKDTSLNEVLGGLPASLDLFHTGSLALTPSQLPMLTALLTELRSRAVLISVDINIRLKGSADVPRYLDGVWSLLRHADLVKASDEDLAAFGQSNDMAERAYAAMDDGILLLTRGEAGVTAFAGDRRVHCKAHPVAEIVDTVGAGDSFHAAFLARLLADGGIRSGLAGVTEARLTEILRYASAAAAINLGRAGCVPPTRDEVIKLLAAAD